MCQVSFVYKVWSELYKEWELSSKQLFIIVRTLAKDKAATQFHSLVIQNIESNLNSFVLRDARYGISCALIDKLRLISYVNYLVLSNQLIERQQLITSFKEFFQGFVFQSNEVQFINENELTAILTFDLTLRKNKTFRPIIWIEDYLIKLLLHSNQQLLLNHSNYDKTAESNLWRRLWEHNEYWSLFQSLYEVQFEAWNTFIAKMQQCVGNFVEIVNKLLQGFQSTEWKDKRSIIQTIDTFYNEVEGQGLVLMVQTYMYFFFQLNCTHNFFDIKDASANDENEALIVRILDQFLQNETNRLHWIRLLVDSMLSELFQKNFKDWLNEDKKEGQPFHSKVIELLSSPTFQNARLYLYYSIFMEALDKRYRNDKWTDDQIKRIQDFEDQKSELFEKVICIMKKDIPQVEELNEENVELESKKLCSNLDYCLKCELWFKQNNPMQKSLFTFLDNVLTNLTKNEKLLPIHVYEYLVTHLNKIKEVFSHLTKLVGMIQRLEEMVKEYRQFSKLINMYKQIRNVFSIEDLPVQLKNREVQEFVKTRNCYNQEIELLKEHEQSMNIMIDIFLEIWKKYNSKPLFIFGRIFQDSNQKWEDFKQVYFSLK
ncbi:hypothetical protein RFI_37125 [Reticulomyxa filosa]|uniref:Uncharacterized protein n=1 Tax=Reticulomyxa filosa TaxID=46433 RepID=X6LG30_RETFI|nr:hypothetical protein RFI_37125 [Reticulomyxa filosa]|eukprot:ETO00321.1 hypothetical protein RFI_37125 [Reticulomyxa filosa]